MRLAGTPSSAHSKAALAVPRAYPLIRRQGIRAAVAVWKTASA